MKLKIKNIALIATLMFCGLFIAGCSDDDPAYTDDKAYPAPALQIKSATEIDVVEYNGIVKVEATTSSAVGIHSVYSTLVKLDIDGEYQEINTNLRKKIKIDTLVTDMTLDFELEHKISEREAVGIMVVSKDVLDKTSSSIIKFKQVIGLPPQLFSEPERFSVVALDEEIRLSVVAKSEVGLKSIKYTMVQQQPSNELRPYTDVVVSGNPLLFTFIIETTIDNPKTEGIKIVTEDVKGVVHEMVIDIESIAGVNKSVALVFDVVEMAPEWENPNNPTQPYLFSFDGITVNGATKNIVSLSDTKAAGVGSVDFAFVNLWRNAQFVSIANRGFAFVGADRLTGGPVARPHDDAWIKPVVRNKTFFNIIPTSVVADKKIDELVANAKPNAETFDLLESMSTLVSDNGNNNNMLLQRLGASSNRPADLCSLQIEDDTYIAVYRGSAKKYGIIHIVKAADDTDALSDGCKIANITTGSGLNNYYTGPNLTGFSYEGVSKLYGRKCTMKIIMQK